MVPRRVRFRYLDRHETLGNMDGFQISGSTVRLIADDCVCIPRGMIQVEGQGELSTRFLESRSN